ncbi:type 1 glutamine amidotransferase [Kiloniella laminariae]|uniref:type 1 glutamine amidotransferase n=1 Tax=Kiloniella laminariae TaxID=454162 RepID=UPI00036A1F69|nr:type 1 glutamine amidotransferase [Kiloniella laminariae]
MSHKPRFLVVDGYAKEGREGLKEGGASTAGDLYVKMLQQQSPGAHCDILYPADPGAALPTGAGLDQYDGIAWTGSSLTIHSDDPKVVPQVAFAKAAYEAQIPSFGSCWAAQIAVVAAGGRCAVNPKDREMGIARKISLTPEGRAHPMYEGKKAVFDAFISHDDEITHLPPNGQILASNDWTAVQAVSVTHKGGAFWAIQYHPEYDLHEMARLCYCRKQKLVDKGFFLNLDDAQKFVDMLEALHQDPSRKDLWWLLGIDHDIINADIRQAEVKNWIERLVIPTMARRR